MIFKFTSHALTVLVRVTAKLFLFLSKVLKSGFNLSMRRRFADDILFFFLTGAFIIDIESIDLDVVFEAAGAVFKVVYMTDVLEVFINELDLESLVSEVKTESVEKIGKICMWLSVCLTDALFPKILKVVDFCIVVLYVIVEAD